MYPSIPPSAASGCQMVSRDVKKTCMVANVRIYVEQVNKNLKDYQILKSEMQLKYLPIIYDIIRTFCALNNLKKPLKCMQHLNI